MYLWIGASCKAVEGSSRISVKRGIDSYGLKT